MHTPEKTQQIKAMKAAKEKVETEMGRILYAFRNGWAVDPAALAGAESALAELVAIAGPAAAKTEGN